MQNTTYDKEMMGNASASQNFLNGEGDGVEYPCTGCPSSLRFLSAYVSPTSSFGVKEIADSFGGVSTNGWTCGAFMEVGGGKG